ncbi:helix-turn-helix domain-containing protein [Klebsiella oxytoca]|nr:helix-turn-helix domain-containing protein [Klebsiella oxytoca]
MKVFGYLLGSEAEGVLFIKERHLLIPLNTLYKPVRLRKTMFRLLEFLLKKGGAELIRDETIMKSVWDSYGLKASGPRLWQVMNALKNKLIALGVSRDFIMRVESRGYRVNTNFFEPLYIRAAWEWLGQFLIERPHSASFSLS